MAATTSAAPTSTALEVVVTRAFDAPRSQVFKAWSGPERLVRWWGPRGFAAIAGKLNLRPGGAWRVGMRSHDGRPALAARRLSRDRRAGAAGLHLGLGGRRGRARPRDAGDGEFRRAGRPDTVDRAPGRFEPPVPQQHPEDDRGDWEDRLERLADLLAEMPTTEEDPMAARPAIVAPPSAAPELVITRVLDAPRSLVFKIWIQPEHLAHWWGPEGFTLLSTDVRPGGAFRVMRAPEGTKPSGGAFIAKSSSPSGSSSRTWTGCGWQTRPGNAVHRDLRGATREDEAHLAPGRLRLGRLARWQRGGWTSSLDRFVEYLANV